MAADWRIIVDVGAADGYYAIGLALAVPSACIIAFEELEVGQDRMQLLAKRNGVLDRLQIRGRCDVYDLEEVLTAHGPILLIVDIEGFEERLLRPELVPSLAQTHILVEVHEFAVKGLEQTLLDRFKFTHRATKIPCESRKLSDLSTVAFWLKIYARHSMMGLLGERLFPTDWYWFEPLIPQVTDTK